MYISLETLAFACFFYAFGSIFLGWLCTPKYREYDEYGGWFDH